MRQAASDERLSLDAVSVEDLNAALRVVRRLPLELLGFLILLPIVGIGLSWLSTALAPPYGLSIHGVKRVLCLHNYLAIRVPASRRSVASARLQWCTNPEM